MLTGTKPTPHLVSFPEFGDPVGIMALPKMEHTKDGFEKQFGVNHLSHFLLFQLLKPALLASASPDFSSRVVSLSSSAHHVASINASDNYNFEKTDYNEWVACMYNGNPF